MNNSFLSTEELAPKLKVKPKTIRWNLCKHGHYMGLVPIKMPNRRLLWLIADVERLLGCNATNSLQIDEKIGA